MSIISQKGATGALSLQANGLFQSSGDGALSTLVGSRYDLSDGREVILVSVGSAGFATSGHLLQDAALVSGHQNATVGAFTAYSANGNVPAKVTLTLGAAAMTANQYAGGFLVVNKGSGIGQTLRIASNSSAISSGTQGTVTLEDGPNVALAVNDRVCLLPAHGSGVVDNPASPSSIHCGVALYPISAGSFGYLTSKGICSALSDSAPASVGEAIAASVTTAGAVTLATATGGVITSTVIGNSVQTGVSAEARAVFVNL